MKQSGQSRNPQQVRYIQKEVDVFIQDQDSPPFQFYLMNELKDDITLTSKVFRGEDVIPVSAGHGFVAAAGEVLCIMERGLVVQAFVKSVALNNVTLVNPLFYNFSTNAVVIRGNVEMAVNGLASPTDFVCKLRNVPVPIDIQTVRLTIWNAAAQGDDAKFGDLVGLANGIRVSKQDGTVQGLGNYRANSDFREFGAVIEYTDRSGGGGNYGVNICFEIKRFFGVVIRIDPRKKDIFKAEVRDNLSTLERFRISIIGQYTVGE